jgi:hypothetical protein
VVTYYSTSLSSISAEILLRNSNSFLPGLLSGVDETLLRIDTGVITPLVADETGKVFVLTGLACAPKQLTFKPACPTFGA